MSSGGATYHHRDTLPKKDIAETDTRDMPSKTDKDIQDIGIDNDNDVDLEVDQDVDLEVDLEVDQETDRDTDIHQQDQDQDIQNKYKIPTRNEQLKFKENELFSSVLFKLKVSFSV